MVKYPVEMYDEVLALEVRFKLPFVTSSGHFIFVMGLLPLKLGASFTGFTVTRMLLESVRFEVS